MNWIEPLIKLLSGLVTYMVGRSAGKTAAEKKSVEEEVSMLQKYRKVANDPELGKDELYDQSTYK
jgi:hypothetical protein